MSDKFHFNTQPLRDTLAIGAVSEDRARIWLRSEQPGLVQLRYWPRAEPSRIRQQELQVDAEVADGTLTAVIPAAGGEPLSAGTPYDVEAVHAEGHKLGTGQFETAPADAASAADYFSIALMSCNQPFDSDGNTQQHAKDSIDAALRTLEGHSTRLVFMLGDQMYTDMPAHLSLFETSHFERVRPRAELADVCDATEEEVRAMLHARYRYFWHQEGWQRLLASYPCYPAIDDHEIIDNWGSNIEHSSEKWQPYFRGARAAYFDYQGSRVLESADAKETFEYSVEYGPLAAYVFDLRSNRRTGDQARMLSQKQFEAFAEFLEAYAEKDVLIIALSVPVVHLPRWAARLGSKITMHANEDFSDRWSTAGHIEDRDRILSMLREHQSRHRHQQVFGISGDIHIACVHEIVWDDDVPPLIQVVASGITNRVGSITQWLSRLSIRANRRVDVSGASQVSGDVRLVEGASPPVKNPYTGLNLGLLEFQRNASGRFEARAAVFGQKASEPVCVFRSRWRGPRQNEATGR